MRLLPRTPAEALAPWLDRAQGLLLLFPAIVLLWFGPRSPLAGDPGPELTGAAVAAFASLPALAVALARRARPSAPWLWAFVAFAAAGLLSRWLHPPTDTLEADRALLLTCVAFAALLGGATLGEDGRLTVARLLPLLALYALGPALLDPSLRPDGILGNKAATSEIALLGATAGMWLFARDDSAWRWPGGAAAVLFALHAGSATVLAGALVATLALAAVAVVSRARRAWTLVLAAACALAFVGGSVATLELNFGGHPSQRHGGERASDTGGLSVRALVWRSTSRMVADHALLGVGPGQFAAEFPPYRDVEEIERSTHGRTLRGVETEVENAHNDWLQGFADAGVLGGLAWLLFLGAVASAGFRRMAARELERSALALPALAILVEALARAPLTWNAASSSAAFACFGALLGRRASGGLLWRISGHAALLLAITAIAFQLVPRALGIAAHGRALAGFVASGDASRLEFALQACPDSVDARSLEARRIERLERASAPERVIAAWNEVLELRPHRFEALVQVGIVHATAGRIEQARASWTHALALDPAHPALLRNLARMEATVGDVEQAERWLAHSRDPREHLLIEYGIEALRELRIDRGWDLLARSGERFAALKSPEIAHALANPTGSTLSPDLAGALEGSAHVAWARQHAQAGRFGDAVRSYRQAKRGLNLEPSAAQPPSWSNALHLELAAALARDGQLDKARSELEGLSHGPSDWMALPDWAGESLLHAGLLSNSAP